ncbi:NAD(P)-dependent dehydrogenase (short-subunit alcohol dehydrogenase family) [Devosia subaequoris]|uniref:NAD(P)-dependent dehydrogenase (Short-subunit alcohol dehydrogenase family) n=1 Tax=Devosia subaequoris TaxID=395930 RepID=A0A7W6IPF0_9HYPH|nr:SDR family oxidoreductase [Devosia subaequoris]MBB4052897.1 NAD(P)-dependent dehydrogenase (short-subunit alcohol dehydrogenase family) [Devosia subaequoris]MCP1210316.1 SDR family oxidoreductase [Devosia subaequoris]
MSEESNQNTNPPQMQDHQPGRETEMHPKPDYMPKFPGNGRLKDKVAIITGGDSGIGRACAVLFAREGAQVALVYLEETEDATITADAVKAEGKEALLLRGDVGDKAFCETVVGQVIENFGKLDVLVNNAAEQHMETALEDISEEQMRRTFETNFFGYMFMAQAALPYLREGASIVNTTSITAYRGSPSLMDYASTKGAIVAFTRSLSGSLAKKGIRVNGVAPGPIWTPLIPASFPADKVAQFGANEPLGRPGQPNEVATSHLFLACDESSYMTGQVLHPNGGEIIGG